MSDPVRKEHYISKFYLKNFANANNVLNVYDRKEQKFFCPTVYNFGYTNDLYETKWIKDQFLLQNDLENHFSEIEKEFNSVIKKVIKICNCPANKNKPILNNQEKNIINRLIANFLFRNPWSMQLYQIDDVSNDILNESEIRNINEMLNKLGFGNINPFIKLASKYLLLDDRREDSVVSKMINDLSKMNYSILKSRESQFITSSFPIVFSFDENDCFNSIYMPINPKYAIIFLTHTISRKFRNRIISMNASDTNRINKAYLNTNIDQNRFLIANNKKVIKQTFNN